MARGVPSDQGARTGRCRESSYVLSRSGFTDERPVEITVAPAPGQPLIVRETGVFTAVDRTVGGRWTSGSSHSRGGRVADALDFAPVDRLS